MADDAKQLVEALRSEALDEEIEERSVENPRTRRVTETVEQAASVASELFYLQEEFESHAVDGATGADNLIRNLADAQTLSGLVRAELSMRDVVARWYMSFKRALFTTRAQK